MGTQSSRPVNAQEEESKQFSAAVLASTEDVWTDIFNREGERYRKPTLVLFAEQADSCVWLSRRGRWSFLLPLAMKSSTSTSRFSVSCRRGFARRETLLKPM